MLHGQVQWAFAGPVKDLWMRRRSPDRESQEGMSTPINGINGSSSLSIAADVAKSTLKRT